MKKLILILASALVLTGAVNSQANLVTGTFAGVVTGTNGVLHGSVSLGGAVSGTFGYDTSFLPPDGSVGLTDHSAYLVFDVVGTGIGVGAANAPGGSSYVTMSIGPDGLPSSSYVFNGSYTGNVAFSGGTGGGGIYNDVGPWGGVQFSVTSYTLSGFNTPDAGTTFALLGFALTSLAGSKRFSR